MTAAEASRVHVAMALLHTLVCCSWHSPAMSEALCTYPPLSTYTKVTVCARSQDCCCTVLRLTIRGGCHSPTCRVCAVDWLEASHYECLLQLLEVMALTGGECHVPIRKTVLVLHRLLQLLCTRPRLHHAVPSTSHRAVDNSTPVSASPSRRRAFVCRRVVALRLPLPRLLPCEHASAQ